MAPSKKKFLGLASLAAAIVLLPVFISNPYYLNLINIIGLNVMIAVGLNLLIGYAGQISLGHAAFYGLGAYISGILTVTYNVPAWPAMAIAVSVTCLLALAIGIPTLKLHGHYLVMATLGFNLIVNIIMVQWDGLTGGPSGFPGIPSLQIGKFYFDSDLKMYFLIWTLTFLSIVPALNLVDSRSGRALRSLHGSEVAAASLGVPTDSYKIRIFVLSAAYASLAGSLYAHYLTFISPKTFDIFFSVELVTMVIVGGMGNLWGVLFGTIFLTSLPNLLHSFNEYKDIVYGLILVLILIFLPEGLVTGIGKRIFGRRTERREADDPESDSTDESPRLSFSLQIPSLPSENGPAVLSVEKVGLSFGGLQALSDVTFRIGQGSITALIGPNGAGKTTLINIVAGIYSPEEGKVLFRERDVTGTPPFKLAAKGLTRTFQNLQIFENMTVLENVMVGVHARSRNEFMWCMLHLPGFRDEERRIRDRAWEILEFCKLTGMADTPAADLPYGLQKKTEMARALASGPDLVLLDEPAAGLNMTESVEMARLILKVRSQGISVLLVEHDMNLVMGISDKVIVLNYGRKIAEGKPGTIRKNEEVIAAYLGSCGTATDPISF